MPYRPYRSDRRAKRRRWLLIILTTLVVIAAIAYLVSRETEQRSAVEFLAAADQSADLHADAAAELEGTLGAIGVITQQELMDRLDDVLATATQANDLLAVEIPASVAEPFGAIVTASGAWVTGVTDLQTAIDRMVSRDIGEEAVTQLRTALDMLRVGDLAYALFLGSVGEPAEGATAVTFPSVTYINPDAQNPLLYHPLTLALKIGSSYELAPRHDISVLGQFEPEPVGDRGGVPLVPYSETISLTAVVTNTGNEEESAVEVILEVFDADLDTTETFTLSIATLTPGGSASVTFADLPIVPGSLYQVTLTATIPDDGRPDDNVWMTSLIRNEEA
jgi:hypothetical protein